MLSLLLILIDPLGHAIIQSPHPLHSSLLILMNPFFKGRSPVQGLKVKRIRSIAFFVKDNFWRDLPLTDPAGEWEFMGCLGKLMRWQLSFSLTFPRRA